MSYKKHKSLKYPKRLASLFFDFYVMNEVWFRTIGLATYGYAVTNFLPHAKETAIDKTFNRVLAEVKAEVIDALEYSVRREIRHFTDRHAGVVDNCRDWGAAEATEDEELEYEANSKKYAKYKAEFRRRGGHDEVDLGTIENMFKDPAIDWEDSYGGECWAEGTAFLIKLKESKTIKDDIFLLDRIFDLQHNNGFILNKTGFKVICAEWSGGATSRKTWSWFHDDFKYTTMLDYRVYSNTKGLAKHASSSVRNLFTANRNYLGV